MASVYRKFDVGKRLSMMTLVLLSITNPLNAQSWYYGYFPFAPTKIHIDSIPCLPSRSDIDFTTDSVAFFFNDTIPVRYSFDRNDKVELGVPLLEEYSLSLQCYYNGETAEFQILRDSVDIYLNYFRRWLHAYDSLNTMIIERDFLEVTLAVYPFDDLEFGQLDSMRAAIILDGDTVCDEFIDGSNSTESGKINLGPLRQCPQFGKIYGPYQEGQIVFYNIHVQISEGRNNRYGAIPYHQKIKNVVVNLVRPRFSDYNFRYYDQKPAKSEMPE
ncbi:hypothetical protein [Phaeocystidibacter luteus]|uniref:Uncharacterized protein n=1 Tax=Phaeocystidibacter luteus TaxID=911197 RepID=A0A6N6RLA0_9FLAO|nr:hypothetical protein [Phaeocystidibacter luteus]KAB2814149.1 hypothetical protein F8C67_00010 [Phaeocystidibacter luteus]